MSDAPNSPWFQLKKETMDALMLRIMDDSTPKTEAEWWARREILDLLEFIHEQVLEWDADGDCGFPAYDHGKRIVERLGAYVGKY